MNTLVLNDLNISKELDRKAMTGVIGGFSHGYGVVRSNMIRAAGS